MNNKVLYVAMLFLVVIIANNLMAQEFEFTSNSLYSDVKGHNVGDLITVLIVEDVNASRESKVNSSMESSTSAGGSVSGNLTDFLPLFGASSDLKNSHDGSEGTQQREKLTGKISVTIVEKLDNGMFRIEGKKIAEVNGEENLMEVEGLVRSRDIRSDNTVYSYNVANAKIIYRKAGIKNKIIKPGTIHKSITWLMGIGLIVIAVLGL